LEITMTAEPDNALELGIIARLRAEKLALEYRAISSELALKRLTELFASVAAEWGPDSLPYIDAALSSARHTLGSPPPSPNGPDWPYDKEASDMARGLVRLTIDSLNAVRAAVQ
jgi:hypothetical protein